MPADQPVPTDHIQRPLVPWQQDDTTAADPQVIGGSHAAVRELANSLKTQETVGFWFLFHER